VISLICIRICTDLIRQQRLIQRSIRTPKKAIRRARRWPPVCAAKAIAGLIYPSVRHQGGRCFVAFDPGIIQNVRPGASWKLVWNGVPEFAIEGL
jgi:hypothetical protein